ncbi:hypothetical protein [Compostibacter hankyongensis]|uniref:Entericidin n=1 Tax=Compostibacter hankyongensis TaxID=1007089 RepID=A0ABP8FRB5_9BACT
MKNLIKVGLFAMAFGLFATACNQGTGTGDNQDSSAIENAAPEETAPMDQQAPADQAPATDSSAAAPDTSAAQ